MCNHENAYIEKAIVGCGYYGYCPDCDLCGDYSNYADEAKYFFESKHGGVIWLKERLNGNSKKNR